MRSREILGRGSSAQSYAQTREISPDIRCAFASHDGKGQIQVWIAEIRLSSALFSHRRCATYEIDVTGGEFLYDHTPERPAVAKLHI